MSMNSLWRGMCLFGTVFFFLMAGDTGMSMQTILMWALWMMLGTICLVLYGYMCFALGERIGYRNGALSKHPAVNKGPRGRRRKE